jgi:hypothetical protein
MRQRFPIYDGSVLDWQILMREVPCRPAQVYAFMSAVFDDDVVIVEVHRALGGAYALQAAAEMIAPNVGHAAIRIATLDFSTLAVIERAGVAASWRVSPEPSTPDPI